MKVTKNPKAFKRLRTASEALRITAGDLGGPVLVRMGQVHRQQQRALFASEGASGGGGAWEPLNAGYEARKRLTLGRRKKLVLTGRTRDRFTKASNPHYIQRFDGSDAGGIYSFGAESDIGAAHHQGDPGLAAGRQTSAAAIVFGGVAPQLPTRDLVTKTREQVAALRNRLAVWYREERIPQVLRHLEPGAEIR